MRTRLAATVFALVVLAGLLAGCGSNGSGGGSSNKEPIVVGSTLSLTGAFAATGQVHKIAGEEFVARLNANGGLLGRKVKWVLLDDQSDQSKVGPLYEKLITKKKVDLIIGPYATPNILPAMGVAERHGYIMPQHTAVLTPLLTYKCQFPAWSLGPRPNVTVPNLLLDAVDSLPSKPKSVVVLTNNAGSTAFISEGHGSDHTGMISIAKKRGLDVTAIEYAPTTKDWAPIATRVRAAKPDLVIDNGLGVDPVNLLQAMAQLHYHPPMMFSLFPAPGPPLTMGGAAEGLLKVSLFEPNKATLDKLGGTAKDIVSEFKRRAKEAGLSYPLFETQAAASWTAWEILADAVKGVGKIDQQAMCDYLHQKGADTTFNGHLSFDPEDNNFWPSTSGIAQIQDGKWVMVWPPSKAAAKLRGPAS